jgi:hypothetical protein
MDILTKKEGKSWKLVMLANGVVSICSTVCDLHYKQCYICNWGKYGVGKMP